MRLTHDGFEDADTLGAAELADDMVRDGEAVDTFECLACEGASVEYADGSGECLVCHKSYPAAEEPPAGLIYPHDVEPLDVAWPESERRVA